MAAVVSDTSSSSVIERSVFSHVEPAPQPLPWWSCPHAQVQLRLRILTLIPGTHSVELSEEAAEDGESSAASSRGLHLRLEVVSEAFENMRSVDRQRLVQRALGDELISGATDTLPSLRCLSPEQWRRNRLHRFEERLRSQVGQIEHITIHDLTDGHAIGGYFDGSGRSLDPRGLELQVTVVSSAFEGVKLLARHQLVQDALGPEILSGAIHALPHLKTWTPSQWEAIVQKAGSAATAAEKGCAKL